MARKRYSREFKLSAVRLVQEQGYSIAEASNSLGVDDQCIRYWIRQLKDEVGEPTGQNASLRSEVQRLREENRRLLTEREILKKAATFFAREQP